MEFVLLPPHPLAHVAVEHRSMSTIMSLVALFGMLPVALDGVRVDASHWVHKVQTVVHSSMLVSILLNLVVGSPHIRKDSGSRSDRIPDRWHQCCCITGFHRIQEALAILSAYTTKHPLLVKLTASIVFTFDIEALVNLHSFARPTNHHRIGQKRHGTDLPTVVVVVDDGILPKVQLMATELN